MIREIQKYKYTTLYQANMARDATYIKTDTAITDTVSVLCFVALRKIVIWITAVIIYEK